MLGPNSRQASRSGQSRYTISDIKDADGLHLYNMAVKFAEKVEKASVSQKDQMVLKASFVEGRVDRQIHSGSPVQQWPALVKARATEAAASVARAAAEARREAALQQQRALEQRAALADQDASEEVLAAKEREIFSAAARVWHSELAGRASTEVEKAKATLQAGKAARSVMPGISQGAFYLDMVTKPAFKSGIVELFIK